MGERYGSFSRKIVGWHRVNECQRTRSTGIKTSLWTSAPRSAIVTPLGSWKPVRLIGLPEAAPVVWDGGQHEPEGKLL
ncbi:hypothetical protein OB236_10290 [Paenibacillus sp. WQ 127069]|uniref:Uncharacterized protein n=1 Tax=Paenibacillus baimaensis TaxID=2982185 RepID=A0ABT2UD44_9BACL|nr:hypothetical protein [Paenibacillus sp. WQ 127069]MCU6792517.1 hypothetical protein [Paenibacillus sp. WQ 127069]